MAFDPELYCALHRGSAGDVDFYVQTCKDADRVLELGCGNGRVTVPVGRSAKAVVGVDNHSGMLALARGRTGIEPALKGRVEFVERSICDLVGLGRFSRVIVPFTTIYCLPRPRLQVCLEEIARVLKPGGILAFDTYPAELFHYSETSRTDFDPLCQIAVGDRVYRVDESTRVCRDDRTIHVTYRHIQLAGNESESTSEYSIVHHYVLLEEWPELLTTAGLPDFTLHGGFDSEPMSEASDRIVVKAGRAD